MTLLEPEIELLDAARLRALSTSAPMLSRLADGFERIFALRSPYAPGLACIGGPIRLDAARSSAAGATSLSATGAGFDPSAAALACLGEAAEQLASFEHEGDALQQPLAPPALEGWIAQACVGAADWMLASNCYGGDPAALPADICLRRAPERRRVQPVGPLSAGVGAGVTRDAARLSATLELVERDAAALWWFGGRPARGLAPDGAAADAASVALDRLRQGDKQRPTRIVDITTDLGVPVAAAWSTDRDGYGLAIGVAARASLAQAVEAALRELAQMEMAAAIAAIKSRQSGFEALNAVDRRHLSRSAVHAEDIAALRAAPAGGTEASADMLAALQRASVDLYEVDLTRPDIGVPVVRVVSPHLQPFALEAVTDRLAREPGFDPASAASAVPLY